MAGFWDFLPTILSVGATIYGTKQKSKADNAAASTEAAAQANAVKAEQAGLATASQVTQANQAAASPGLVADQAIINRGTALTPAQLQAVADSRIATINAMSGTGLRGSARAVSAAIADNDQRERNNFMQQNQNEADTAAGHLTGQYFAAGNNLATNAVAGGQAVSSGLVNTGNIQGNNTIGQGNLSGQAIGDIGATVANVAKSNIVQSNLGNPVSVTGQPVAAPSNYKTIQNGVV